MYNNFANATTILSDPIVSNPTSLSHPKDIPYGKAMRNEVFTLLDKDIMHLSKLPSISDIRPWRYWFCT